MIPELPYANENDRRAIEAGYLSAVDVIFNGGSAPSLELKADISDLHKAALLDQAAQVAGWDGATGKWSTSPGSGPDRAESPYDTDRLHELGRIAAFNAQANPGDPSIPVRPTYPRKA